MKNVFVPHTQYNLVISVALIEQQYKSDDNTLILFTDFAISDSLKNFLSSYFTNVLFLPGTYPAINKKWSAKVKQIPNAIDSMKALLKGKYNRLFWVCDTAVPEIWLLKDLHGKNEKLEIRWLEDGALPYFYNFATNTGLNKNSFTRSVRKCFGRMKFGKYYSYKDTNIIGSSKWNQEYCLTCPESVRSDFSDKPALKVEDEYFKTAVKKIYDSCDCDIEDDSVLILMDKLDVYKNIDSISDAVKKIVDTSTLARKSIYYKYHPREESSLSVLNSCIQIPKTIGAEGIYAKNIGKKIKVIGIKSTGLQTALKSGFKVASIAVMVKEDNLELMSFYKSIGIEIVEKPDEIMRFLQ